MRQKRRRKKRSSPNFGWEIRKIGLNSESWEGILGKLGPHFILVGKVGKFGEIRKVHWVN